MAEKIKVANQKLQKAIRILDKRIRVLEARMATMNANYTNYHELREELAAMKRIREIFEL